MSDFEIFNINLIIIILRKMNVKIKYISIFANMCLVLLCAYDQVRPALGGVIYTARNYRIKRQDGYVYDRPKVSFDLPTSTTIAPTQAPTVDRTQMQMYYAYPAPAGGAGDTVNIGYQTTGSSGATSSTVSTGAAGYNYGVQNTQVTATQNAADTGSQDTAVSGYQNTAITGTQTVVSSGSTGYSSGSTGYSSGRPTSVSNTVFSDGGVSTNAPKYLPPQTSGNAGVDVSVTTTNQAKTGTTVSAPSETYIPPSVQVSSPQNTVSVTQSGANTATSSANVPSPNTGYLSPSLQSQPTLPVSNPTTSTVTVSTQSQPAQPVPNQQYLPPIESSAGSNTQQGTVTAPASTYLPPVF